MNHVFIVSDGTGQTATMALEAARMQFPGVEVEYHTKSKVDSEAKIKSIIQEASKFNAFIVHTLVSNRMRGFMVKEARLNNIETIDIMGPLLSRLSNQLALSPSEKPGLFHHLNEEYFRKVETMNFAFKHDDGLRSNELTKAEIILIGVSRTFKTPLSVYLAFKGWLVANIPIILNIKPEANIFQVKPHKVFYLSTTATRLTQLRQVRNQRLGEAGGEYSNYEYVKKELEYAYSIYCRNPDWTLINVTNKSIEEIASEIIVMVRSYRD